MLQTLERPGALVTSPDERSIAGAKSHLQVRSGQHAHRNPDNAPPSSPTNWQETVHARENGSSPEESDTVSLSGDILCENPQTEQPCDHGVSEVASWTTATIGKILTDGTAKGYKSESIPIIAVLLEEGESAR